MHLNLTLDHDTFGAQLAHEIAAGGLAVPDTIERLLARWLEESISRSIGQRIIKNPRSVVHPIYYANRFQNLSVLSQEGYSTWYPEARFSTAKNDIFDISQVHVSGFELGGIEYGGGVKRQHRHAVKTLKTQVNHTVRLDVIKIPPDVFTFVVREVEEVKLAQPDIANLSVGIEQFVDDRIEGFRTVSFDHVISGERKFCECHSDAHAAMLLDAKARLPRYAANSWPRRVVGLLERANYKKGICHFCIAEQHGKDALVDWYGNQLRHHFHPYVDLLVRGKGMDRRTATSEARRRLSISRWGREDDLYELVAELFPHIEIRREASPHWLGQQRLDIYLPDLAVAVEHQGEQHFHPIGAFGGEPALRETLARDRRKRTLCRENGVTVVDIRFDEPLTLPALRKRLQRWLPR